MSQKSSKCECHHHQATAEKKRAVKKPKSKSASTEAVTAKSVDKKNVKQGLGNPENKLDVKISKNQVGKVVETKHVASTQTSSAFKVKTKSTASWKQTPSGNRPAGGKKEIFTSTTKNGLRKELVADQVEEVTVINSVLAERNQRTPRAGGKNNVDMVTIATQTMTSVSIATQTEFDDDDDDESSSSSEDDSEDAICRNSDCRNPFLVTDEDDIYLFECMKCGSDGYCKMCLDECIVCGFLQCKSCLLLNEPCMNCGYGGFYELNETCDSCQHYKFSVRPCRVCKTRRVCPDCTRHCGNCFLLTFACVRCLIDCGTLCSNRDCESRIADCGCTKNMCTISCDSCQSGYVCFICAADCDICKRHHCEDCVMDFVICEHCGFQMCEACGNEYNYESEESCCYCLNNNFSVAYCDLVNRKCFHGVRGGVEKYNGPYKSRAQFKYELSAATRSSCAKCNKQPGIDQLKLCSRCKSAPYCSRSCQQMDWKKHKQMCGDYIPFDQLPFISACLEEYYERTEKDRKKLCYDAKKNETQIKTNGFESK
ncbi:uncharacterized protein LOC141913213 [Tubulanus polymorphus]|uniref:uncharacterized protein LOC141913213 n=1 Tax=Tubulanus polymorphus TaxID=672921 RepID=UPI003DA41157